MGLSPAASLKSHVSRTSLCFPFVREKLLWEREPSKRHWWKWDLIICALGLNGGRVYRKNWRRWKWHKVRQPSQSAALHHFPMIHHEEIRPNAHLMQISQKNTWAGSRLSLSLELNGLGWPWPTHWISELLKINASNVHKIFLNSTQIKYIC